MANHASAQKRNRQRLTRTLRNRALRSFVRKALKQARQAVAQGSADAARLVNDVAGLLDRAASKRVLPSERASRLKSRLASLLNRAKTGK